MHVTLKFKIPCKISNGYQTFEEKMKSWQICQICQMNTIDICAWDRWNSAWVMWNSISFKPINRGSFSFVKHPKIVKLISF